MTQSKCISRIVFQVTKRKDHKGFKTIHMKIICSQENLLVSPAVLQQPENGHLAKRQVEGHKCLPPPLTDLKVLLK